MKKQIESQFQPKFVDFRNRLGTDLFTGFEAIISTKVFQDGTPQYSEDTIGFFVCCQNLYSILILKEGSNDVSCKVVYRVVKELSTQYDRIISAFHSLRMKDFFGVFTDIYTCLGVVHSDLQNFLDYVRDENPIFGTIFTCKQVSLIRSFK